MTNDPYKTNPENHLSDEIYSGTKKISIIWKMSFLGLFSISLLIALPWGSFFKSNAVSQNSSKNSENSSMLSMKSLSLASLTGCAITMGKSEWNFFPPGPTFYKLMIPGSCVDTSQDIVIEKMTVTLGGPSFSPLGIVFNATLLYQGIHLDAKIALGFGEQIISIFNDKIPLSQVAKLLEDQGQFSLLLGGVANLDLKISLDMAKKQLHNLNLSLTSKNFELPAQTISLLAIPDLNLKTLNIKAQGKKNNIVIERFILGEASTPIFINGKGNILLNSENPVFSSLDLSTDLRLSQEFANQFALIATMLTSYKKAENSYSFKIKGSIAAPDINPN